MNSGSSSAVPRSGNSVSTSPNSKFARGESMAYPASTSGHFVTKLQYVARQNTKLVSAIAAFVLIGILVTSDELSGSSGGLRATNYQRLHWGGAMHAGLFSVDDVVVDNGGGVKEFHFAAVSDLDQLSIVDKESSKPSFKSIFIPGTLTQQADGRYHIAFETHRELITKHNEAGRGAEFSELTLYNNRLLTFDDRTGDVFEIINDAPSSSVVVPRFIITEGEGDTDKGMKWEWATVKGTELYLGSMGKEYTAPDGTILNENNLWIGVLNERGELRRENWKTQYNVVRTALGAAAPGYMIMEAILWSEHLQKWVFLPRRISADAYDEDRDERSGGHQLVLVDAAFANPTVVDIVGMELEDGLRGFSSFAFVPGTQDRHALAIRTVEDNCTGDLDVCTQRSYFTVLDVTTGAVLMDEETKYTDDIKLEGVEFVNIH